MRLRTEKTSRSRPSGTIEKATRSRPSGNLRIGDHWNAITIIALSQSNPLKAVAELVENSIDAGAKSVVITRGKDKGQHYLRIKDDGEGVRRNADGEPDFHYVATHVCDSIKRRLKAEGRRELQGEFGIGLLSFWTLGEELLLTSSGESGRAWQMHLRKGDPSYRIALRPALFPERGTEVLIRGILPGIKNFSGEKIQWYLASELRDRIRHSGVDIRVVDRTARAEFRVEPRKYEGRLLHELDATLPAQGELYAELYLHAHAPTNVVSLFRSGTRVLDNIAELDAFARSPWTSGYIQGIIDAPYLNLTPGTRLGVIHDAALARLAVDLAPLEARLAKIVADQQRAEEERTSRDVLRSVQGALKEALLALPADEYDWFDLNRGDGRRRPRTLAQAKAADSALAEGSAAAEEPAIEANDGEYPDGAEPQRQFFEYAGPLFSAVISPTSSVVEINASRPLRAVARDRARRTIDTDLAFAWRIVEGDATLDRVDAQIVAFRAGSEPGLVRVEVVVTQRDVVCHAEAQVTVTASLVDRTGRSDSAYQGLPGYTYQKAAGELWRSRFDGERNLVVINNGHRDFVYAARNRMLKLRYICRLFAKELVLRNFAGVPHDELLERLLELTLYTEEHLR
ncbi:MAG TPA: ATP-binding protein [Casimicrobiaceae bacterium]|nr:ATP-binding protein [Casimicrobiaceae bacterium]